MLEAFLALIFSGVLVGFFWTKTTGFGPFNTSTLIAILVLLVATVAFVSGKFSGDDLSKILFALVGFAAGMFSKGKES